MTQDSTEHGLPPEESLSGVRVRCRELARDGYGPDAIADALVAELDFDRDWLYLIAHAEVGRAMEWLEV